MNATVIRGCDLTDRHLGVWSEIQRSDPALSSPFFRPEFTRAVAAVRSDVYVAEITDNGQTVAFFPFCKGRMKIGRPVGQPLCDFQGIIGPVDAAWAETHLLGQCDLAAWEFDHLLCGQRLFETQQIATEESPFIDVSDGYAHYRAKRRGAGRRAFRRLEEKMRQMDREIGPLCVRSDVRDPALLELVMSWKSAQWRRTGKLDLFRLDWSRRLLELIFEQADDDFAGTLSVLYAGDTVAAAHMGMRSGTVLHWWFPTYNHTLAKYSPGLLLLLQLVSSAETLGIKRIDLGKGDESYKRRFMSGSEMVAVGRAERPSLAMYARRVGQIGVRVAKSMPLPRRVKGAARFVRLGRSWLKYR